MVENGGRVADHLKEKKGGWGVDYVLHLSLMVIL